MKTLLAFVLLIVIALALASLFVWFRKQGVEWGPTP